MLHQTIHLNDHFPILAQDGCDPTLTLYLPDVLEEMGWTDTKRPSVLVCPGGGYAYVSNREAEPIALKLLAWGYNVFVLNYSCCPHPFPVQLTQVAAAMELIWANADLWHTDPERIAIMGFSAGGHLAAHYSNCYDIDPVRQLFPDSKPVKASILCYSVITALPQHRHEASFQNLSGHMLLTQEDIDTFSAEKLVTARTPATFLWHTAQDSCVPVMNSLLYAQALSANAVPFALHIYPFGGHGLSTADGMTCNPQEAPVLATQKWLSELRIWLESNL